MNRHVLHIGMTVSNLEKTIDFYTKYLEFRQEGEIGVFPEEFIASHETLYHLPKGSYARFCFLQARDGVEIELFEFHPAEGAEMPAWSRPGFHHICLKVEDIQQTYQQLREAGVSFFFAPENRALPEEHWVFLQDPDGNLIELQD